MYERCVCIETAFTYQTVCPELKRKKDKLYVSEVLEKGNNFLDTKQIQSLCQESTGCLLVKVSILKALHTLIGRQFMPTSTVSPLKNDFVVINALLYSSLQTCKTTPSKPSKEVASLDDEGTTELQHWIGPVSQTFLPVGTAVHIQVYA